MQSRELREQLGLSRGDWARALNVKDITVKRWEDQNVDPAGLALEIMLGIQAALDEGLDPVRVGKLVSLGGLRSLVCYGLVKRLRHPEPATAGRINGMHRRRNA